ncbi:MAG: hypothetical protein QOH84_2567, partial [Kribbellaceae bacterium]|nr:hypothetical protein [Kribbellaceae bacterium]
MTSHPPINADPGVEIGYPAARVAGA